MTLPVNNTAILTPVTALRPWDRNPRRITEARWTALLASLERDPDGLWGRPLQAIPDGTVFAGNMRLRAAQHLGWPAVPVVVRDLTATQVRDIAIRDNTPGSGTKNASAAARSSTTWPGPRQRKTPRASTPALSAASMRLQAVRSSMPCCLAQRSSERLPPSPSVDPGHAPPSLGRAEGVTSSVPFSASTGG